MDQRAERQREVEAGALSRAVRRLGSALAGLSAHSRAAAPAEPPVTVRRVTFEGARAPRKERPEPPSLPRRTLAIGPYAPPVERRSSVVVALHAAPRLNDNIFREDFTG